MAGNSTIKLQEIVDDAASLGDVSPALATGGLSDAPALSIAHDVMAAMTLGGPMGQPFNWKWNRQNTKPFATIGLQQDYFIPGAVQIGWLENCYAVNINQVSNFKQKVTLEVHKDLDVAYFQTGYPSKICWLPNDQMQSGTWGAHPLGPTTGNPTGELASGTGSTGMMNPGPNVIYTNPIGVVQAPFNPTTCITDPNGNLWVLTTFGACGAVQPTWPSTPSYPTLASPNTAATTVADGTCVWTAVNPKGQGFRLSPVPAQAAVVWQIQPIAQMRPVRFSSLGQTLEPIPDDYAMYFKQGFIAECYRRNPDPKVRAKYPQERQLWLEALEHSIRQGDRQLDDVGFYPGSGVMDTGYMLNPINPLQPYGPWVG